MTYHMNLSVNRTPNGWTALATVPMRDGRILRVTATGTLSEARARLGAVREEVGLSLRTLIRQAKNTAKKLAKSKALKLLGRIAKSPVFQSLLPPQVTMALNGIKAAARAIKAARRGSRAALAAIREATSNPAGAAALRMARGALGPATRVCCRCPA